MSALAFRSLNARYCVGDDQACAAAFGIVVNVSPTIFRDGPFRFFFFSRE